MPANTYDAIIVGSGITGGWAAKELTDAQALVAARTKELDAANQALTVAQDAANKSEAQRVAAEKVLAVRQGWSEKNPAIVAALVRACAQAAEFIEQPANRAEAARILAQPERLGVNPDVIQRTLDGQLRISPDGTIRESNRYLLIGRDGATRPEAVQAAWLYAQMVRWGQTRIDAGAWHAAMAVFRPDLYDAALGRSGGESAARSTPFTAFAGPVFDPADIAGYLASFAVARRAP